MKRILMFSVSALAIAGCGSAKDTNWSNDCVKHHSETGREFQQCREKLKRMKAAKVHAQEAMEKGPAAPVAAAPTAPAAPAAPAARVEDREIPAGLVTVDPEGSDMESFGREQGKKSRGSVSTPKTME